MGQFVRARVPRRQVSDVTAPNADTLYSTAWLDVAKEPWVLSCRTWATAISSCRCSTAGPTCSRSGHADDREQGPEIRDHGAGLERSAARGTHGTQVPHEHGLDTRPNVLHRHAGGLQGGATRSGQVRLVPLSAYGKPYTPPAGKVDPTIDMKTPVREQVNKMDAGDILHLLAALMKDNPPAAADAPMVAKIVKIGIVPGKDFDDSKLDPAVAKGIAKAPKIGFEKIMAHFKDAGKPENGWTFTTKTGVYGTEYLQRALVTAIGLGANRPQDADLSDVGRRRRRRQELRRREQVRHAFREGPNAAGRWRFGRSRCTTRIISSWTTR